MKIKNIDMVNFLNACDGLIKKHLPMKVSYALILNRKTLFEFVEVYRQKHAEVVKSGKPEELNELLSMEIDANIQTVTMEDMEKIDSSDRYDALTMEECAALNFMIDSKS